MKALDREILRLSLPSILANITVPLVGLVDTAVAGHLHSAAGTSAEFIGGISVGAMVLNVIYWNFAFLRAGTGGLTAQVIATPGHTPGGACFLFAAQKLLLTGDTLFAGSCGRTDFPGGDSRQLNASLRRLAALDPELTVVPGHGEPTTIAREVATNPFLQ